LESQGSAGSHTRNVNSLPTTTVASSFAPTKASWKKKKTASSHGNYGASSLSPPPGKEGSHISLNASFAKPSSSYAPTKASWKQGISSFSSLVDSTGPRQEGQSETIRRRTTQGIPTLTPNGAASHDLSVCTSSSSSKNNTGRPQHDAIKSYAPTMASWKTTTSVTDQQPPHATSNGAVPTFGSEPKTPSNHHNSGSYLSTLVAGRIHGTDHVLSNAAPAQIDAGNGAHNAWDSAPSRSTGSSSFAPFQSSWKDNSTPSVHFSPLVNEQSPATACFLNPVDNVTWHSRVRYQ
jgi:hypothetical protein